MAESIIEYIREHKDTYTREAIDRELIDRGYPEDEIAAAWEEIEGTRPVERKSSSRFWLTFFISLLATPVVIALVGRLIYAIDKSNYGFKALIGMAILALVYIVGSLIAYFSLRANKHDVAKALLAAMLVSVCIPFIPGAIIFGVCTVGQY
ncbi:MAG TPA: hypothetical protein VH186_36620 [Chloroflexia bacterium]|nr:hypothetical protein [Chloroflexia bacterium]